MNLLLVFVGGGLGALARYVVSLFFLSQSFFHALIPNLLGCFLIGLFSHLYLIQNDHLRILIIVGFVGGFTTFSGYIGFIANEGLTIKMLTYFFLNNFFGLMLYFIGSKLA